MLDTLYQYTFCFHPLFLGILCILYSKLLFIWHRLSPFHGRGQKVITWTMYIPHFRQYSCTQYMCPKSSINLSTMRKRQETIQYAFIAFILALKNPKFLLIHLITDQDFFVYLSRCLQHRLFKVRLKTLFSMIEVSPLINGRKSASMPYYICYCRKLRNLFFCSFDCISPPKGDGKLHQCMQSQRGTEIMSFQ